MPLNTWSSHILLEAKDSNCLVLAANQGLWVYSLKGALLASFKEHTMPISAICVVGWFLMWNSINIPSPVEICCFIHYNMPSVSEEDQFVWSSHIQDSFRVVTASQDLSLRVLTWRNDRDHGLTLDSQYHLLGGSHTMSRYYMLYALVWACCINSSQVSISY